MAYKNRLTNRQIADALHMAQWVDASPHEWPTSDKIPHLCYAVLDLYQHRHEAQELLAAARSRAEKAERERDEMAKRNRELREVVDTQVGQIEAACKQAEAAEAEREAEYHRGFRQAFAEVAISIGCDMKSLYKNELWAQKVMAIEADVQDRFGIDLDSDEYPKHKNLRAAIDAAMKEAK